LKARVLWLSPDDPFHYGRFVRPRMRGRRWCGWVDFRRDLPSAGVYLMDCPGFMIRAPEAEEIGEHRTACAAMAAVNQGATVPWCTIIVRNRVLASAGGVHSAGPTLLMR